MVARDLRNGVQYKPVDMSQLEQMIGGADIMSLMENPAAGAAAEDFGDSGLNLEGMVGQAMQGIDSVLQLRQTVKRGSRAVRGLVRDEMILRE